MPKKEDRMTDRERIEALLQRRKPDRVPIWPFASHGFAAVYRNLSIGDAYSNPRASYTAQRETCRDFGWVFFPFFIYASMGAWEFGGEVKWPRGEFDQAPIVIRHPVEKDEDVYNLKWPGPDAGFFPLASEFGRIARSEWLDNEPFNSPIAGGACFSMCGNIAGVERFLRWLIKKPDLAHYLLRFIADWKLDTLPRQRESLGIDGVLPMGGEATTSNQLISPRQFEEFAYPYIREIQEKVIDLGYKTSYVHICGDQNLNLPIWAKIPFGDPGIISIGHEVKLETAALYFPDHIILGNLEPAIVQAGTPKEVYEATRKVVEEGKNIAGGYIFSTGCDLPPKAPEINVRMMTKAVDDFGWYD